jgi:glycine cleavage system H protein
MTDPMIASDPYADVQTLTRGPTVAVPDDRKYSEQHEWVLLTAEDPRVARVGITDFAQSALGDIVFVQLPAEGDAVTAGEPFGEVESTKSVSDIYAPCNGTVRAHNADLEESPELVNRDPYGDGWLVEITVSSDGADQLEEMLDADAYQDHLDRS